MSINLWSFITHVVTLPSAHNSLEDVLGKDAAKVVSALAHDAIASAAANALGFALLTGITGVSAIQSHVANEVTKALKNTSPALATEINNKISAAIGDAETVVAGQIPSLVENIAKAVGGVLKVS